jgi:hypothetical protein
MLDIILLCICVGHTTTNNSRIIYPQWDPPHLHPWWWEPLISTRESPNCNTVIDIVQMHGEYGRTNNLLLSWVHIIAYVATRRPTTAVLIPTNVQNQLGTAFQIHESTRGWMCVLASHNNSNFTLLTTTAKSAFYAAENNRFGTIFRATILSHILLRPLSTIRNVITKFEQENHLHPGQYDIIHLRGMENSCERRLSRNNNSLFDTLYTLHNTSFTITHVDICNMSSRYLEAVFTHRYGNRDRYPVVLAHDRQNPDRAADIVKTYFAAVYTGPNDVYIDILLMIRGAFLIGNPASTMSMVPASVRHKHGLCSNFNPTAAYHMGAGRFIHNHASRLNPK